MNIIKTDKFDDNYAKIKTHELSSQLEKLRQNLEGTSSPMTSVLSSKSRRLEDNIWVYRMGKFRLFWSVAGTNILFLDVTRRSWLRW